MDPLYQNSEPAHNPDDQKSIFQMAGILLEKIWIFILMILVGVAMAYWYLQQEETLYSSRAILQLEQREPTAIGGGQTQDGDLRAADLLRTVEQNLTTDDLFGRIVEANDLKNDPGFVEHLDGRKPGKQRLVRQVASRVTVKARRGTRLIDVWVDDTDPERAQLLATSLVEEAIRQQFELRAAGSAMANEFLQKEAARLKQNLETSETALQEYKESNNAVSLEERQDITVEKLREINMNVTEAKANRLRLEADLAQVSSMERDARALLNVQSIANAPEVLDAAKKITDQEAVIGNLRQRYLPKHPAYVQATSQLEELNEAMRRSALVAADRLQSEYNAALSSEQRLEQSLRDQEQVALDLNKLSVQYNVLSRQVESDLQLHEAVMKRLGETELAMGFGQSIFRVVQSPVIPGSPSWPKTNLIYILGAFAGGIVGAGLILALTLFDSSFRSIGQAEKATGYSVVGVIPAIDATTVGSRPPSALSKALRYCMPTSLRKNLHPLDSLYVVDQPTSAIAEAFRSLRAVMLLLSSKQSNDYQQSSSNSSGPQVIIFTSAMPSEGKSFCAANYATSLALAGHRTVLIDADLRRPMVDSYFENKDEAPGLGQHLQGRPVDECIQSTRVERLSVITAGDLIENPAEAFSGPVMGELINALRSRFDRIVIDSAPVNSVSDTLLIANVADAVCLVVLAASTSAASVRRACGSLVKAKAKLSGLILNRMPTSAGLNYNYYYSTTDKRNKAARIKRRSGRGYSGTPAGSQKQKSPATAAESLPEQKELVTK